MTDPTLCYNTVGLSSRIGGWGGRKRASFLWFTEGFETQDLQEAKAVLAELS
jgi:hypothetical protein